MSFGAGPFGKSINVAAQVVNGVCPTCNHEGMRAFPRGSEIKMEIHGEES